MKSKIKIGILADTREKAIEYCKQIINDNGIEYNKQGKILTEKEFYMFIWISKENCCGMRFNYIYANKNDINTDWFNYVVKPMLYPSIGII